MNKNTLFLSLLFVGMVGLYILHFSKSKDRIAYVDSGRLLNGYKAMAQAREDFNVKTKAWKSNVDSLVSGVQTEIKLYEKGVGAMSPSEKSAVEGRIRAKQQQLANYQRAVQENAQKEDARLTQQVVSEVNAFLVRYGKERGYKLILVASQAGTIAYAEEEMDITDTVLQELNEEFGNGGKN